MIVFTCMEYAKPIKCNVGIIGYSRTFTYSSGQAIPSEEGKPLRDVIRVVVNGEELHHLRIRFPSLPDQDGMDEVTWKGELAQFIYNYFYYIQ